jgi:hypothetical protein
MQPQCVVHGLRLRTLIPADVDRHTPGIVLEDALAFRFDEDAQIVDQWLGSNFVEMFVQLGWGFAPVGEVVPERG